MAPKGRRGRAAKTVVKTKKVVEETVKVVVPEGEEESDNVEMLIASSEEQENVEISTYTKEESIIKKIPIEVPQAEQEDDEDETQPASEPETAPTQLPKPKEAPLPKQTSPTKEVPVTAKETSRRKRGRNGGSAVRGGREGYKRYVFKVMKQVHPEMGISSNAMTVINNLIWDMFERLAEEAARLQRHAGRRTMSSREVQGAVKLVLPGDLGLHAIAEGSKALKNYVSYVSGG